jgi:hypothetical protein
MQDKDTVLRSDIWSRIGVLTITVLLLSVLMLTPVRTLLNSIPFFWSVIYPILTLFALYVLINTLHVRQNGIEILKWVLFFVSTASMTVAYFSKIPGFFSVGRILAIIYIVLELTTFTLDIFTPYVEKTNQ